MSLSSLPDDLLNKLIEFRDETIKEKIEKIENGFEISQIYNMLDEQQNVIRERMSRVFHRNSIMHLTFEKDCKAFKGRKSGLFLINSVYLTGKMNAINVARVVPDKKNYRSFGYYKIVEPSTYLRVCNVIKYSLEFQPPAIDWETLDKRQMLGVSTPIFVYPNAPQLSEFDRGDITSHGDILFDMDMVNLRNKYTYVELKKVNKYKVTCDAPMDTNDPRPNRSVIRMSLPKSAFYLLDKLPPHVRECVY